MTSGIREAEASDEALLTHTAVVESVEPKAIVVSVAAQGCASCGRKNGCGIGRLAGASKAVLVRLPAAGGLRPGDPVTVAVGQRDLHRAALLGYLLPAASLVAGAIAGEAWLGGDSGAAGGAGAGFLSGLAALRLLPVFFHGAVAPLFLLADRSRSDASTAGLD